MNTSTINELLRQETKKLMQNFENGSMIDSDYTDNVQMCIEATLSVVAANLQQMCQDDIAEIREECSEKLQTEMKSLLDRNSLLLDRSMSTMLILAEKVGKSPMQSVVDSSTAPAESSSPQ